MHENEKIYILMKIKYIKVKDMKQKYFWRDMKQKYF